MYRDEISEEVWRNRDKYAKSFQRYGVFVHSYILMPEHAHIIISIADGSETTLGKWVKAFKAMVARHEFRWQSGFYDHVLRSDQSRTEKWEYVRNNSVRAGLVEHADEWPYAQRFSRLDGEEL